MLGKLKVQLVPSSVCGRFGNLCDTYFFVCDADAAGVCVCVWDSI